MRILVACEESQIVTKAFRDKGHEAFSCDIKPCGGDNQEWHIQADVRSILYPAKQWDMIIAFPPCTYLANSGNRWFNEKYGDAAVQRQQKRVEAIEFLMLFATHPCSKVVIENPVGVINRIWRAPDQVFHPFYFGDEFNKRTCLWLKGVPKLRPTRIVGVKDRTWYYKTPSYLGRQTTRSRTFPGVAKAMAEQWG